MALADEITNDLAEVFSTDEWATSATYKVDGSGSGTTIAVHFVNEFEAAFQAPTQSESSRPYADCKTSDVSAATHSSTLTIGAQVYQVIGVEPFTAHITRLLLSHDAD